MRLKISSNYVFHKIRNGGREVIKEQRMGMREEGRRIKNRSGGGEEGMMTREGG